MKIALLTVFTSLALGWLMADGAVDFAASPVVIPTFGLLALIIDNCSANRFRSQGNTYKFWWSSRGLFIAAVGGSIALTLLPTLFVSAFDPRTRMVLMPIILLQTVLVIGSIKEESLSPSLLVGHLFVFVAGLLVSSCIGSVLSVFWGWGYGTVWHILFQFEITASVVLTLPLLVFLEKMNFKILGGSVKMTTFRMLLVPALLISALILNVLPALWLYIPPSSFVLELSWSVESHMRWFAALSNLPILMALFCQFILQDSRKEPSKLGVD
ncbi:MAG: hypothetical protein KC777_13095 [Cyanobacteria bacterium HKST-UBA02]|nr:hypothetical protein [Cyanobacteria bacterium HKST-UBA02]